MLSRNFYSTLLWEGEGTIPVPLPYVLLLLFFY